MIIFKMLAIRMTEKNKQTKEVNIPYLNLIIILTLAIKLFCLKKYRSCQTRKIQGHQFFHILVCDTLLALHFWNKPF